MDMDLTAKRLHVLKEITPKSSNVGVLFHPPFPATLAPWLKLGPPESGSG